MTLYSISSTNKLTMRCIQISSEPKTDAAVEFEVCLSSDFVVGWRNGTTNVASLAGRGPIDEQQDFAVGVR